jgi:hypothetical protein
LVVVSLVTGTLVRALLVATALIATALITAAALIVVTGAAIVVVGGRARIANLWCVVLVATILATTVSIPIAVITAVRRPLRLGCL